MSETTVKNLLDAANARVCALILDDDWWGVFRVPESLPGCLMNRACGLIFAPDAFPGGMRQG